MCGLFIRVCAYVCVTSTEFPYTKSVHQALVGQSSAPAEDIFSWWNIMELSLKSRDCKNRLLNYTAMPSSIMYLNAQDKKNRRNSHKKYKHERTMTYLEIRLSRSEMEFARKSKMNKQKYKIKTNNIKLPTISGNSIQVKNSVSTNL